MEDILTLFYIKCIINAISGKSLLLILSVVCPWIFSNLGI